MIVIYRLLINSITLLSPFIILLRLIKKKEDLVRFKEKFTFFSKKRRNGNLVWFHGASVGEMLSIIPLIRKLERKKNINQILITSSTISSAEIFLKFKFKKTIHQYFPIDTNSFTKRFLKYWNPNLVVFIESEIWPNMLTNLKKRSIPHILLNARVTKKSFRRWKLLGKFSEKLFCSFNATYPQNLETERYLKKLKVKKIKKLGNLKFSHDTFDEENPLKKNLKFFLEKKKYWCAVSTHEGEELICSRIHQKLQKKIKNLITIIIPRHVQRSTQIETEINNIGLKTHFHSSQKKINDDTNIYIVDTYGETKTFFKNSKIVFLGKSLCAEGGQNPLEPARYGCKVLHGPNISNFKEIYELLNKKNIAFKVNNQNKLLNKISELLKKNINIVKNNNKINLIGKNILKKTFSELESLIS